MRACLGFLFGRVEMQREEVPKWLAEKLVRSHQQLKDKMASKELYNALKIFETRLSGMLEVSKDRTLQRENTHLRRILADEQRQRRQLMNQLQDAKGNVRVLCRVRPILRMERQQKLKPAEYQFVGNRLLKC